MNATVKVVLAAMISGTLCGLGVYLFSHESLTMRLATATQEAANAKAEASKLSTNAEADRTDFLQTRKMLTDALNMCQGRLSKEKTDIAEYKAILSTRAGELFACENRLNEQQPSTSVAAPRDDREPAFAMHGTRFRGMPWGSTRKYVKQHEAGELAGERDSSLYYKGSIANLDMAYAYVFVDEQLVKGVFRSLQDHVNKTMFLADYASVKNLLTQKYGEPARDSTTWLDDLYRNDTSEYGMAVSVGHLMLSAEWRLPDTQIILGLNGDNFEISLAARYTSTKFGHKHETRVLADSLKGL